MQVKATKLGYYGLKRKKPGEVFFLKGDKEFSPKWMEKIEVDADDDGDEASVRHGKKGHHKKAKAKHDDAEASEKSSGESVI